MRLSTNRIALVYLCFYFNQVQLHLIHKWLYSNSIWHPFECVFTTIASCHLGTGTVTPSTSMGRRSAMAVIPASFALTIRSASKSAVNSIITFCAPTLPHVIKTPPAHSGPLLQQNNWLNRGSEKCWLPSSRLYCWLQSACKVQVASR